MLKTHLRATDNVDVTALLPTASVPPPLPSAAVPPTAMAPVSIVGPEIVPVPSSGPRLSDEHLRQLAASHAATRTIRRAIGVARFDGWAVGVFAALTILFGVGSISGIVLGAALGAVAAVELSAANRLRRFDVAATRVLGFNQLALAAVLTAYALWRIHAVVTGPGAYAAYAGEADLARALAPVEDLTRLINLVTYAALIAIAVFAQGGLSLYYFTRAAHVRAYLAQTPGWVIDIQKAGGLA